MAEPAGAPNFEALYRSDPDPWRVAESLYEQRKLDLVLAVLGRPSYALAWDPACGTGHLAHRLADRAEAVRATDMAAEAVQLTAELCTGLDRVQVDAATLPEAPDFADRQPDLIVISEVFYYLNDQDRPATVDLIDRIGAPVCELVAVHWKGVPEDAQLSGLGAQHELVSRLALRGWSHQTHHDDVEFVIDTLIRQRRRRART